MLTNLTLHLLVYPQVLDSAVMEREQATSDLIKSTSTDQENYSTESK